MASGGNRWLQFLNNRGRGRSRDQIIETSLFKFFKFSLPHHISSLVDVFNHSFWKLYIKVINDLTQALIYLSVRFEPAINIFKVTIDLELKIRYSSCRKGSISVVGIHSRKAHIQTIW